MKLINNQIPVLTIILVVLSCGQNNYEKKEMVSAVKIPVIFDTDTNNELDDQHALAYLLLNGNTFEVKGVTVNATFNGGDINQHYEEAERVIKLCGLEGQIPLYKGANGKFTDIRSRLKNADFDGSDAVEFMIETAKEMEDTLTIIAVGKLTNLALAMEKDPSLADKIRIVWLGSNYPEPGEYNQVNDTSAMNHLLKTNVPFEMVTVRYGKPSGTDAVRVTQMEVNEKMPGKGPEIADPVTGRHGGNFTNFGDYSVNLFENIDYHGDPPSRALFDMAAVAIVKNPDWADYSLIPCPVLIEGKWVEQPDNNREIGVWENFKKDEILKDFYDIFDNYVLADSN